MMRYRSLVMFFFMCAGASPALAQSSPASAPTTAPTTPAPASAPAAAPAKFDMFDGQWHFAVAPYLWLPRINGTLNAPALLNSDGSIAVSAGPSSYLKSVTGGVLLTALARRGNFGLIGDLVYLNASQSTANLRTVNTLRGPLTTTVQTQERLTETIFTGGASYTVVRRAGSSLDVLLGFRYLAVGGALGVQAYPPPPLPALAASRTGTGSGANAVFGTYGNVALSDRWFVPYYIDAGTGSADFTWMGWAGIGYGSPYNGIVLVYKNLYYNHNGQGLLDNNVDMGGPALGYVFRF
jgi:hypothetical protein